MLKNCSCTNWGKCNRTQVGSQRQKTGILSHLNWMENRDHTFQWRPRLFLSPPPHPYTTAAHHYTCFISWSCADVGGASAGVSVDALLLGGDCVRLVERLQQMRRWIVVDVSGWAGQHQLLRTRQLTDAALFSTVVNLRSTSSSTASHHQYQLRLGRQRQTWLIPLEDKTQGVQVQLWYPSTMRATYTDRLRDFYV